MSWRYCADSYRLVGNQVLDFLLGGHTGSKATIFGHTIGKEKPIVISSYFAATVCFLSCCMTYITELTASSMQNGWSLLCCMLHVWFDCWFNLAARLVWLEMHVCYMHFFWPASVLSHDARDRRVVHDFFTTNNCLDVAQTFPDILQIYSTPNAGSPIAVIYRRLIAWPVSLQFPSHPKCRVPRQQDLLLFSIYVNDMIWIYVYIYL